MARAVLLPVFFCASGCIMPPPIEEGAEVRNQPPRIVPETLSPPPSVLPKVISDACESYQFFASVTDPDPDDTIYWRVFINYPLDPQPLQSEVNQELPNSADPFESWPIEITVRTNDERFGLRDYSEPHTIELLVSDRPFVTEGRYPLGRLAEEDGELDSFLWTVKLTSDPDLACNP